MIITFKQRPLSIAQKLAYVMALGVLAAITAGCDKLSNQTALSSITGDSSAVPEEIADLCMNATNYSVRQVFDEMPNHFSAKDAKWEQDGGNHIWRATLYNVLEQRDIPVSLQFDVFDLYSPRPCGSQVLRFQTGLVDGQYINVPDFSQLFGKVFGALYEKYPIVEAEPSPASAPTPIIDNSVVDSSSSNSVASNEAVDDSADESSPDTGSNATNSY